MRATNRYKIGDVVVIKNADFLSKYAYKYSIAQPMIDGYASCKAIIKKIEHHPTYGTMYRLDIDSGTYFWCEDTLIKTTFKNNEDIRSIVNDI